MATFTRTLAKVFVVNARGEVLFLRRSATDTNRPLQWDLPGGNVEPGETLEQGAIRETDEEAGIKLSSVRPVYAITEARDWGVGTWLFFAADVDDPEVTLSYEHDDYRWVKLEDILPEITYELHHAVIEFLLTHKLLQK